MYGPTTFIISEWLPKYILANQMFWDICSKRPNVLGQDLTEEDNRAKICFDKSETESEIIV